MRFKLGMIVGSAIGYLVASGKARDLIAQVQQRVGAATTPVDPAEVSFADAAAGGV